MQHLFSRTRARSGLQAVLGAIGGLILLPAAASAAAPVTIGYDSAQSTVTVKGGVDADPDITISTAAGGATLRIELAADAYDVSAGCPIESNDPTLVVNCPLAETVVVDASPTAAAHGANVTFTDPVHSLLNVHVIGTNSGDTVRFNGSFELEETVIEGRGGDDAIHGSPGTDWIDGGSGNDMIYGGPGDDVIYGGPGRDTIIAGAGSDKVFAADGEIDHVINCGTGGDPDPDPDRVDLVERDYADPAGTDCGREVPGAGGSITITGQAVVGSTLTASHPTPYGDSTDDHDAPIPTIFAWLHCDATSDECVELPEGESNQLVVPAEAVGRVIVVDARRRGEILGEQRGVMPLRSAPTAIITGIVAPKPPAGGPTPPSAPGSGESTPTPPWTPPAPSDLSVGGSRSLADLFRGQPAPRPVPGAPLGDQRALLLPPAAAAPVNNAPAPRVPVWFDPGQDRPANPVPPAGFPIGGVACAPDCAVRTETVLFDESPYLRRLIEAAAKQGDLYHKQQSAQRLIEQLLRDTAAADPEPQVTPDPGATDPDPASEAAQSRAELQAKRLAELEAQRQAAILRTEELRQEQERRRREIEERRRAEADKMLEQLRNARDRAPARAHGASAVRGARTAPADRRAAPRRSSRPPGRVLSLPRVRRCNASATRACVLAFHPTRAELAKVRKAKRVFAHIKVTATNRDGTTARTWTSVQTVERRAAKRKTTKAKPAQPSKPRK